MTNKYYLFSVCFLFFLIIWSPTCLPCLVRQPVGKCPRATVLLHACTLLAQQAPALWLPLQALRCYLLCGSLSSLGDQLAEWAGRIAATCKTVDCCTNQRMGKIKSVFSPILLSHLSAKQSQKRKRYWRAHWAISPPETSYVPVSGKHGEDTVCLNLTCSVFSFLLCRQQPVD